LFESYRVALKNIVGLRIRLPGSVEVIDPVAESSKAGEEREKKERRKKSKGKGKGKERVREVEEKEVEDLDEYATRRARIVEVLARKKVDLEILVTEIESIEKMLEN
jgi:hypothetical protein